MHTSLFAMAAGVFTFARFFPKNNARYDYGLLIFTLTFVFISVSGYQDDEILELAYKRLSTMLLGSFTCIIVSIMVFPVWAGEDLRILIASNMEKLGSFLEGPHSSPLFHSLKLAVILRTYIFPLTKHIFLQVLQMSTLKWLIPNKINPSDRDIKLFLILKIMKMHW